MWRENYGAAWRSIWISFQIRQHHFSLINLTIVFLFVFALVFCLSCYRCLISSLLVFVVFFYVVFVVFVVFVFVLVVVFIIFVIV